MYNPPICPNESCGKPLTRVHETSYETYIFDPKTGYYHESDLFGDMEIRCPSCGCRIEDVFPEGACNYNVE